MNNGKGLGSQNLRQYTAGLLAIFALVAVCGLARPAAAAEGIDYNSSRSNKTSGLADPGPGGEGGGAGKSSPKLAEAVLKVEEIDAMVAALQLQLQALETACYDLQVLSTEVDEEMSEDSEASAQELAQLEEAQRIFTEQIAMLLDESSISVVSGDLAKKKKDKELQIESWSFGANNAGMAVSVDPLMENLASLNEVFASLKVAYQEVRGHMTKPRSNIQNN
ncbi:hypothetical protein IT575_01795 [bacterium]|nr:hypothetical protein [bacterium]